MRPALLHRARATAPPARAPARTSRPLPTPQRAGCPCGGGCPACREGRPAPQVTHAGTDRRRLQRKPKDVASSVPTPSEFPATVGTTATTAEAGVKGREVVSGSVEAATPFYPGDVFLVAVSKIDAEFPPGSLTLTLPPGDLELVDTAGGATAWLRVIAPPESIGAGRTVEVVLATPAVADPITLRLRIAPTPDRATIARTEKEIVDELVAVRQEIGDVRSEMRDLPPEEREGHEETLIALRRQRSALRAAESAPEGLPCSSGGRLEVIQEAIDIASGRVGRAIARLQGAIDSDAEVTAALVQFLRVDPAPEAADARRATVQKCLDVLNTARTGMLTAGPEQFDCVSGLTGDCATNKAKAASVSAPGPRGRMVTICPLLFSGAIPSRVGETGQGDLRAFVIFHEFVHLTGISAQATKLPTEADEMYVFDPLWPQLTPEQTGSLADAYAALAFALSQAAGG